MAKSSNVLLILTDQHRLSAVGAYGSTPCRTPNIDRLAHQTVWRTRAFGSRMPILCVLFAARRGQL